MHTLTLLVWLTLGLAKFFILFTLFQKWITINLLRNTHQWMVSFFILRIENKLNPFVKILAWKFSRLVSFVFAYLYEILHICTHYIHHQNLYGLYDYDHKCSGHMILYSFFHLFSFNLIILFFLDSVSGLFQGLFLNHFQYSMWFISASYTVSLITDFRIDFHIFHFHILL